MDGNPFSSIVFQPSNELVCFFLSGKFCFLVTLVVVVVILLVWLWFLLVFLLDPLALHISLLNLLYNSVRFISTNLFPSKNEMTSLIHFCCTTCSFHELCHIIWKRIFLKLSHCWTTEGEKGTLSTPLILKYEFSFEKWYLLCYGKKTNKQS